MAQTKTGKKKTALTESVTQAAAKKANKALARAVKAVEAAQEAVADSHRKLRNEALALSKQTEKMAAKHDQAARRLADEVAKATKKAKSAPKKNKGKQKKAAVLKALPEETTPHRALASPKSTTKKALAPAVPATLPAGPTVIELRRRAKEQQIAGYSRLNKAALLSALQPSQ